MQWGWLRWWAPRPNELAVPISFGEYTDEAWLAIEDAADVCGCYTGVAPCGRDRDAHLILGGMAGAAMEARDSGYCAAGQLVEARALGSGC